MVCPELLRLHHWRSARFWQMSQVWEADVSTEAEVNGHLPVSGWTWGLGVWKAAVTLGPQVWADNSPTGPALNVGYQRAHSLCPTFCLCRTGSLSLGLQGSRNVTRSPPITKGKYITGSCTLNSNTIIINAEICWILRYQVLCKATNGVTLPVLQNIHSTISNVIGPIWQSRKLRQWGAN